MLKMKDKTLSVNNLCWKPDNENYILNNISEDFQILLGCYEKIA